MKGIEVLVDKVFMLDIKYDRLNSLDFRSDIENNNIYGCVLVSRGYIGNRPSYCTEQFHEDDTWAIDVITEDGHAVTSYLYVSEYEYDQDVELISKYD